MEIFLSYASSDRRVADEVRLALLGARYEVFMSDADLAPGSNFNSEIRHAIKRCDRCIFLISPDAVKDGRYTATELALVKQKWKTPWGFVLTVIIKETPGESIDPYFACETRLVPKANVGAEVAAAIERMPKSPGTDKTATAPWRIWTVKAALFFVALCFVDALIPGTASLTIYGPNEMPMTLETLQVETIPVGPFGEVGGDFIRYDRFDSRGVSEIPIRLGMLETHVRCRVFDKSAPSSSVISELVYIPPFFRRGFFTKVVHL
jgi:hypothetical protein